MEKTSYRLPAEWEAQSAVMLTWPHEATDWAPYLDEITQTMTEMARAIARHEAVMIVAFDTKRLPEEIQQMENVYAVELPTDDTWARDHGPIVLVPREEGIGMKEEGIGMKEEGREMKDEGGEMKDEGLGMKDEGGEMKDEGSEVPKPLWLDFRFNGWGEKFEAAWDNMLPLKIWALYGFLDDADYEDHQDFVLEGGSIECDGRGTVFTTSQCLLAPHRNQPLTRDEIERELKRRLRADRVVWLDHGTLTGDDTDGHIDTIVRCAPDDTLLYIGCDDKNDEQYADFKALEAQLKQLRTIDGRPYRLLRLPMPAPIYYDGERLPATYANFLVVNGAVLVPTYGQEDADTEALRTIQEAFPDREMVPIDARIIIRQHGSVHCLTMQIPQCIPFD